MNVLITSKPIEKRIKAIPKKGFREWLGLHFDKTEEGACIEKIKSITGGFYHPQYEKWYVPNTSQVVKKLKSLFGSNINFEAELNTMISSKAQVCDGSKVVVSPLGKQMLSVKVSVYKRGWIDIIKAIPGRYWNPDKKYWCIPYVKESLRILEQVGRSNLKFTFTISRSIPEEIGVLNRSIKSKSRKKSLNEVQKTALNELEEQLMLERKSWRTIKSYKCHLIQFLLKHPTVLPSEITGEKIRKYIFNKITKEQVAVSTQNQLINALKVYYVRVLGQDEKLLQIPRPKKPRQLPNVFSPEEVEVLINSCDNLKHKVLISLTYSAGLRKGEVLNLRVRDVLYNRNCIFVKSAKGQKDRFVMLAPTAGALIKEYRKQYSPRYWLFEGQTRGQYSETSFQKVFTNAKEKARVNPMVTIHGLRHSYATHLIERGVPLHVIKEMLGHNSIKTTEMYLHISTEFLSRIKSPLEYLTID